MTINPSFEAEWSFLSMALLRTFTVPQWQVNYCTTTQTLKTSKY